MTATAERPLTMFSCNWCFYWCTWEQNVLKLSLCCLYTVPHLFVPQQIICHFDYLPPKIPQIHFIQSCSEVPGYMTVCLLKETCCCWLSRSWMCDLLNISWNGDESIVLLVSYRLHLTQVQTCHHCVFRTAPVEGWRRLSAGLCSLDSRTGSLDSHIVSCF